MQRALDAAGVGARIVELDVAARTAQQAADALGIEVGQIAKSLIFRAATSGRAVLVIAAGDRRVSEARIAQLVGEPIERATPDFVREHIGIRDRRGRTDRARAADADLHRRLAATL